VKRTPGVSDESFTLRYAHCVKHCLTRLRGTSFHVRRYRRNEMTRETRGMEYAPGVERGTRREEYPPIGSHITGRIRSSVQPPSAPGQYTGHNLESRECEATLLLVSVPSPARPGSLLSSYQSVPAPRESTGIPSHLKGTREPSGGDQPGVAGASALTGT
jgi:hypothetical protein